MIITFYTIPREQGLLMLAFKGMPAQQTKLQFKVQLDSPGVVFVGSTSIAKAKRTPQQAESRTSETSARVCQAQNCENGDCGKTQNQHTDHGDFMIL